MDNFWLSFHIYLCSLIFSFSLSKLSFFSIRPFHSPPSLNSLFCLSRFLPSFHLFFRFLLAIFQPFPFSVFITLFTVLPFSLSLRSSLPSFPLLVLNASFHPFPFHFLSLYSLSRRFRFFPPFHLFFLFPFPYPIPLSSRSLFPLLPSIPFTLSA